MIEVNKPKIMKHFNRIFDKLLEEREKQIEKYGDQHHNVYEWLTILTQQLGDACNPALQMKIPNFEREIIQIGAVAIAILEDLYDTYPNELEKEKKLKRKLRHCSDCLQCFFYKGNWVCYLTRHIIEKPNEEKICRHFKNNKEAEKK